MNIKILGTGCPNCQKLEANAKQAVKELGLKAQIEKITDLQEIMNYGVLGFPAMAVGDEIKIYGRVASVNEIRELLTK